MALPHLPRHRLRLAPAYLALLAGITMSMSFSTLAGATTRVARTSRDRPSSSGGSGILLALGDSLAAGYQPVDGHKLPPVDPTTGLPDGGYPGGYAADLAGRLHLQLIDLACPGETTASFTGRPAERACAELYEHDFSASSQLGAALFELATHKRAVDVVTFDLGANNVDGCLSASGLDLSCVERGIATAGRQLPSALARLRDALKVDDPTAHLVAMSYYDPFLGLAYRPGGPKGIAAAALSVAGLDSFNGVLERLYRRAGIAVANVAGAFSTTSLLPVATYQGKRLPEDVDVVCRLTWMCPGPTSKLGADIHPNTAGYARIANAFEAALDALRPARL